MRRSFIREILDYIKQDTISFAGGLPNADLFPTKKLEEASNVIMNDNSYLQYSSSNGYDKLRQSIANIYTNDGFKTSKENILITSGSQQALDLISRYYSNKSITIEKPSYLGAMNVFKLNNMNIDAINMNSYNYSLDIFDKSIKKTKLAYLIPDFQNPTGYTYSKEQREFIINSILKNNAVLIEDSPYSELYFEKKFKNISSSIPNNSYHLGSFSKVLAPGLRVGYIRASKELIEPLIAYKEAMDLHTNNISQYILYEYLKNNNEFENHKNTIRKVYKKKSQIFQSYLDEILPEFIYTKPKGGMFIYGRLNHINTSVLINNCIKKGVVFVPGNEFYLNSNNQNEIRFNFTHTSSKDVYKGLHIIKKEIQKIKQCNTL